MIVPAVLMIVPASPINPKYLPPRPAAWIILLHDLAWHWKRSSLTCNLAAGLLKKLKGPNNDKRQPPTFSGWAWYLHNDNWIHFPLPCFDLFRQLDRFLAIWNDSLRNATRPQPMGEVVDLWGKAAWIAVGPECRYKGHASREPLKDSENKDLKKFRERLFANHDYLSSFINKGE